MTSVEAIGNSLWDYGPEYLPEEKIKQLDRLPELRQSIQRQIDIPADKTLSIALIDWTSLDNTRRLMEGNSGNILDPFVALLDLSVLVCAAVFYDYIVVIDGRGTARKVNDLFGLNIVRGIDPHTLSDADGRMQKLLNAHFVTAVFELEKATQSPNPDAPWIEWLKDSWKQLLSIKEFPSHDWENYDTNLGYTPSPDRKIGGVIFEKGEESYTLRSNEDYSDLILDNDVRALFYEYLARTFDWMISDKADSSIRYIGGCLRTPMLLTRAKLAASKLEPHSHIEDLLQSEWKTLDLNKQYPVKLPLWMDAALANAHDPFSFAKSVKDLRKTAGRFRRSKSALESKIRWGNDEQIHNLVDKLQGDASLLSKETSEISKDIIDIGTQTGKIVAPMVPWDLAKPLSQVIGEIDQKWCKGLGLRLFRPQLWFIYNMGRNGKKIQRSTEKAFNVFSLQKGLVATKPIEFLKQFGDLQLLT